MKLDKVRTILSIEQPAAAGRAHYLSSEAASIFNLQYLGQKFPGFYAVIKALLSPTFSTHSWRSQVPDVKAKTVINLGAGTTELHPEMINVDFVGFPSVDIVADFSRPLPIRDSSVDGVVSISVLEHLENPRAVVDEVRRILMPGGTFYLATPFQYPFHGAPCDYTRWTVPGLKALLADGFEVVEAGSRGGPMGVLILALGHIVGSLFCLGSKQLYSTLNFTMFALLSPLKLLDLVFSRLPFATTLCPGLYVTARKL